MSTHDHTAGRGRVHMNIALARAGRALAAPIADQLEAWHRRAAYLAALTNHRILRGQPLEGVRDKVRTLTDEIISDLDIWRRQMSDVDMSGRVEDAEKSARSTLATLDALRSRLG